MRTKISEISASKGLEDMDFAELQSSDLAAVQAAVDAVVAAETQGMISCSCCTELYENVHELHFHQTSKHSVEELSLALISLRGIDLQLSNFDSMDPIKEEMETEHLRELLFDSATLRSYESDGETTITVNSDSRMFLESPEYCDPQPEDEGMVFKEASGSCFLDQKPIFTHVLDLQMCDRFSEGEQSLKQSNIDDSVHVNCSIDINGNNITRRIKSEKCDMEDHQHLAPLSNFASDGEQCSALHNHHLTTSDGTMIDMGEPNQFKSYPSDWFASNSKKVSAKKKVSFSLQDDKRCHTSNLPQENMSSLLEPNPQSKMERNMKSQKKAMGKKGSNTKICEQRQFVCFCCGKVYTKKSHLERHMRVHTGEKPFACPVCSKRFGIQSVLKQHIRIHTGEKPYSCSVCFQRFPQKSGLMTHMMLHNGKPFKCQYCVKSFVSNHKLRHHLRSHGYEPDTNPRVGQYCCPECYMRFFTIGALMEHRKVHSHEPHNFSSSYGKSHDYVTITEEAARAAVSVIGKSIECCDSALENELKSGILDGDSLPQDNFLFKHSSLVTDNLFSNAYHLKSDALMCQ